MLQRIGLSLKCPKMIYFSCSRQNWLLTITTELDFWTSYFSKTGLKEREVLMQAAASTVFEHLWSWNVRIVAVILFLITCQSA